MPQNFFEKYSVKNKKDLCFSTKVFLVPVIGVEPIRCRHHWILSPARLPIPSHRRLLRYYNSFGCKLQPLFCIFLNFFQIIFWGVTKYCKPCQKNIANLVKKISLQYEKKCVIITVFIYFTLEIEGILWDSFPRYSEITVKKK